MTVKELEFDAQHFIEAHTTLVDVVVTTATEHPDAIAMREACFHGIFGRLYFTAAALVSASIAKSTKARTFAARCWRDGYRA
jgi:hypothetical protein